MSGPGTVAGVELRGDISVVGGRAIVALSGVADLSTLPTLRDLLMRTVVLHPDATVAVDLDGVGVLDDAALGVVLGMAGRLRERGHDLVVVATRPAVLDRFRVTGFDRAVAVVPSLAEVRVAP